MLNKLLVLVLAAAGAAAPVSRERVPVSSQAWNTRWPVQDAVLQSGTLSFTGHATLGTFVGTTTAVRGAVNGSADVTTAHGWVEASVATLATGNDHRDRDMRASMEVDKYPTMRFDLTGVAVESAGPPPDTVHAQLHGRLTIHGVTQDVAIPATIVFIGGATDLTGGFPLDLADYHIGGLTRLLGTLRMQRNIEVSFRLHFEATSHTTAGELDQ